MTATVISTKEMALWYAGIGLPVVPEHSPNPNSPTRCDCTKPDCTKPAKHPRTANGSLDATTSTEKIEYWWGLWPHANLGTDAGLADVVVVAPDSPEWDAEFQRRGLEGAAVAQSGGGVGHKQYWFRRSATCPKARICKPEMYDLMSNGNVMIAGSEHVSGNRYTWLEPPTSIADLPEEPEWVRKDMLAAKQSAAVEIVDDEPDAPPVRYHSERKLRRWRGELVERKKDGTADRSESLFYIGLDLAEANASRRTIILALEERDRSLGWNTYTKRQDGPKRYAEIAAKAITREDQRRAESASDLLSWPVHEADPAVGGPANGSCSAHCNRHLEVIETQKKITSELRTELQHAQTADTANGKRLGHLKHFRQTSTFSGKRKDVVESIAFTVERARLRGESEVPIFYGDRDAKKEGRDPGGLAGTAGTSPHTVESTIDLLRNAQESPWVFQPYKDDRGFRRVKVVFDRESTIERDLAQLAALPKAETVRKDPLRCPDHQNAKLHVAKSCTVCGVVVAEYEETPPKTQSLVATYNKDSADPPTPSDGVGSSSRMSGFPTRPARLQPATRPPAATTDYGFDPDALEQERHRAEMPWILRETLALGVSLGCPSLLVNGTVLRGSKGWQRLAEPSMLPHLPDAYRAAEAIAAQRAQAGGGA